MKRKRHPQVSAKPILELRAKGPGVRSGRVPVPELIRICQDAQNAVNRQAERMEGRKTLHPGPIAQNIRHECTLELIGLKRGSTRLQFDLARPQRPLFAERPSFGSDVVAAVARTIRELATAKPVLEETDPGVLQALYNLGAVTEGRRVTEIEWVSPEREERQRIVARVDRKVREHVAAHLSSPRKVERKIDGILDMADFKPSDLKCRIDPAIGAPVICTFDERNATDIQLLIRQPVRVTGIAVIAPYTDRVETLHIDQIGRLPSLSLGEGDFFAERSLAELASAQRVKPVKDLGALCDGFPPDEDIDEFLHEIYSARK